MYIDCCKIPENIKINKNKNKNKRKKNNNSKTYKKCIRKKDNKLFSLPRKFTKKQCKKPKGFTMRSSCAPYKYCSH